MNLMYFSAGINIYKHNHAVLYPLLLYILASMGKMDDMKTFRFGLGPENPVQIAFHGYRNQTSERFDMHYELEMGLVLSGRIRRFLGENRREDIEAGEPWFCGVWQPHGVQILDAPCEVFVALIRPALLMNLHLPEAEGVNWMLPFSQSSNRPRLHQKDRQELVRLASQMKTLDSGSIPHRHVRLRWAMLDLLLFYIEVSNSNNNTPSSVSRNPIEPALNLAFSSRELVTNTEAAEACGLSEDIFIRQFRKLMGLSFSKFSLRQRLSRAAASLKETDHSLLSIAKSWGFADESHLTRLFRSHYGCTPGQYRSHGTLGFPWPAA